FPYDQDGVPPSPVPAAPEPSAAYPEPRPRRIGAERAAALVEILLCSGLPTQLLLIGVLSAFGMSFQGTDGGLNPQFVFTLSLLDAVLVVGLVIVRLRAHHESVREILIGRVRVWREVLLGI